jgi:hypothetical protein
MIRVYADVNVQRPAEYWDYENLTINWGYVTSPFSDVFSNASSLFLFHMVEFSFIIEILILVTRRTMK